MYRWITFVLHAVYLLHKVFSKSAFNHHIKNYEITDCHVSLSWKFNTSSDSIFPENSRLQYEADAEIYFRAFNRTFHLLLYEDLKFQDLKIYHLYTSMQPNQSKSKFYEGIFKGNSLNSIVVGYLYDNVFSGSIKEDDIIYFIEPASFFLSNPNYSSKVVVYRSKDIKPEEYKTSAKNLSQDSINNFLFPFLIRLQNSRNAIPRGIKKTSNQSNADYACQIEMVADHTLYQYFKKDTDALSAFLYLHGKYADFIFRRTDFDGDGFPDNIRIVVKKISIYKTSNDPNYPMAKVPDLVSFLDAFTQRSSENYCISFCLCHRTYESAAVGHAYRPNPGPYGTAGGICQFPIRRGSIKRHLNTGVVTILNSRNEVMPLITTLLAVTHEMGHLFGSDHDPLNDSYCSPGGDMGYYIMYPRTSKVFKPMNSHFSPCSRKSIHRIITERGECLKVHPATCGNGVREGDEECDCGWEKSCHHLDSCCTPSDAESPEKGCTFRKKTGSHCSPRESKCCTRDCTVNKSNGTECYKSDKKCVVSLCDGVSAECPKPTKSPDMYPCLQNSKTCSRGYCNSSICLDNNLKECTCKSLRISCFVCCLKNRECRPAHKLNLHSPYSSVFMVLEGTHCKSGNFQCDGSGNCIDVSSRKLEMNEDHKITWWMLVILSVVLFTLSLMFCYLLRKHLTT